MTGRAVFAKLFFRNSFTNSFVIVPIRLTVLSGLQKDIVIGMSDLNSHDGFLFNQVLRGEHIADSCDQLDKQPWNGKKIADWKSLQRRPCKAPYIETRRVSVMEMEELDTDSSIAPSTAPTLSTSSTGSTRSADSTSLERSIATASSGYVPSEASTPVGSDVSGISERSPVRA